MSETIPRWSLPEIDFVETDSATIQAEIINKYEQVSGRSLATGDPVRLFLLAIADIIIQQREAINIAGQQNLLSYAQGEYLDALGQYLAVTRLPASSAVTTIKFTLSQSLADAYTIPAGCQITNGIVTFATDSELVITAGNLTATAPATCTVSGETGNDYLAGQINTIVNPMTFVASAENSTTTSGGADEESDEDFAERIRLAPNAFSVAGPTKAYEFHTYSVSSAIIDVSVTTPQAGYVNVYPLLENGEIPSSDVLDEVYDHLSADNIRPLTDYLQVLAPTAVNYSINVDYWISKDDLSNSTGIQAKVNQAVQSYKAWQQAKIGRDIAPEKLLAMVVNAGAIRVDSSTLSPGAFTTISDSQVAQCSSVTVTYQGTKDE